jgi:hypothetical protein
MASALRQAKVIDWSKVKAVLAPQDFVVVSEHRGRSMELARILAAPLPKLDFSQYRNKLANKDLVDQVESYVQGFQPDSVDVSEVVKSLNEQQHTAVCHE